MENRLKLELEINQPTHIKLLFDEPIIGDSQYGKYYLYAICNGNNKEYSFFAPTEVHEALKRCKKGDVVSITKIASQKGKKLVTTYDIQLLETEESQNKMNSTSKAQTNLQKDDDFYYNAMEKSLDEAFRLTQKFNGLSPSQIGISIFIQRTRSNGFAHE